LSFFLSLILNRHRQFPCPFQAPRQPAERLSCSISTLPPVLRRPFSPPDSPSGPRHKQALFPSRQWRGRFQSHCSRRQRQAPPKNGCCCRYSSGGHVAVSVIADCVSVIGGQAVAGGIGHGYVAQVVSLLDTLRAFRCDVAGGVIGKSYWLISVSGTVTTRFATAKIGGNVAWFASILRLWRCMSWAQAAARSTRSEVRLLV